jgi:hypothetical protein
MPRNLTGNNNSVVLRLLQANTFEEGVEFKEVTWVTPYKEAPENRRGALTKNERDWNKAITKVRARLECPFGEVKQKWSALSQPWAEDEAQLDHLVKLSFAFYTFKKSG